MVNLNKIQKNYLKSDLAICANDQFSILVGNGNFRGRDEVENFIKKVFLKSYSAKIEVTYPVILYVKNKEDEIVAALGVRSAKNNKLFLERYLDKDLINFFADFKNKNLSRRQIAEVGNLAAKNFSALKFLIKFCVKTLADSGFKYICLTGIKSLYNYFLLLGLNPKIIAQATLDKVENSENWGSYYSSNPKVIIGDISSIQNKIGLDLDVKLAISKTGKGRFL